MKIDIDIYKLYVIVTVEQIKQHEQYDLKTQDARCKMQDARQQLHKYVFKMC